jgi:hypothetical protein
MSRDHSQNHYGPNASFDGYDSDLASAGILIESLRQQLAEAENDLGVVKPFAEECSKWIGSFGNLRQQLAEREKQVTLLLEFVAKISEQVPEKPDYWSSCSQCEYNSRDAQDIIEALAATKEQDHE